MTDIEDIARRIGFDHARDDVAAKILRELVMNGGIAAKVNQTLSHLERKLENKIIFVTGAAISLKEDYGMVKTLLDEHGDDIEIVAADGTCKYLLENGRLPTAVTSDLDGGIDNILAAGREGSTIVVLAHGDNMELVKDFFTRLKLPENEKVAVIPVVQVSDPEPPLYNFGGFTDGDRGVSFSTTLAKKVILIGFDYSGKIGPYSKPGILEESGAFNQRKKVKLTIAREIIDIAAEHHPGKIWTINSGSVTDHVKLATVSIINQFVKQLAVKI
ncbi:MAG: 6-hydroxymethylpterin diphosphokinase MptE-like protein [Candidatus Odinarchaeota archaeon]